MYPSPGSVERIGGDWDWIWVDGQHGQLGYTEMLSIVRACDLIQRPAFVRVPGHDAGTIGLALDTGAAGVIVPQVHTVAQARAVVQAAKFPPLGDRSYGGRRPIDRAGRGYSDDANAAVRLIVQIESPEALDQAEAIAAVPGVDALFLGPDDIVLRTGGSMTAPRPPEVLAGFMEKMALACHNHGKIPVTVGMGEGILELCCALRYGMIVAGGDVAFLATGSKAASEAARKRVVEGQAGPVDARVAKALY